MRILIATTQVPFVQGGAEMLAQGLLTALNEHGHQAEIVAIPFRWYPSSRVPEHMLACQLLDITNCSGVDVDLVIGLKFPAYLIPHPNKVLWIVHQHRTAYDLWDHPLSDLIHSPGGDSIRDTIISTDCKIIPEAKRIFTIAENVSKRLKKYCNIGSNPLYHPPAHADKFFKDKAQNYFFFPSRISRLKRQDLVIEALALCKENVVVKFAGNKDDQDYFHELNQLAKNKNLKNRVIWLGKITEEEKREHYARSLGVIFPPLDEDYGYITLEAMLSSKPVITCLDSGGPLEFVLDKKTGLIAEPTAESLAKAMDFLWQEQKTAAEWGNNASSHYSDMKISWSNVVKRLLS